jgi:hypothetical protein
MHSVAMRIFGQPWFDQLGLYAKRATIRAADDRNS